MLNQAALANPSLSRTSQAEPESANGEVSLAPAGPAPAGPALAGPALAVPALAVPAPALLALAKLALAGATPEELDAAFAYCRMVTRARARNFYYGLRLTPEPRRSAIFAIYTWMRGADDAVDDAGTHEERKARLVEYQRTTDEVLRGERKAASLGPHWLAFAATVASYPVDRAIFRDMIEGLAADLSAADFQTEAELSRYCYCVAGTAGLACLSIWGLRPGVDAQHAHQLAVHRGEAFQRTNILRDFAQDFDEHPRRIYLPVECWRAHALAHEDLRNWRDAARCEALLREQIAIARSHYAASANLETMIDPDCAPTLWAMSRIYSGLLDRIEGDPRRIISKRIRLPAVQKASIALGAAIKARMGRW